MCPWSKQLPWSDHPLPSALCAAQPLPGVPLGWECHQQMLSWMMGAHGAISPLPQYCHGYRSHPIQDFAFIFAVTCRMLGHVQSWFLDAVLFLFGVMQMKALGVGEYLECCFFFPYLNQKLWTLHKYVLFFSSLWLGWGIAAGRSCADMFQAWLAVTSRNV